jgi:MFS family permease
LVFEFLTRDFKISGRKFFAVLTLFFPSLAWFFLFESYLREFITSFLSSPPDPFWISFGLLLYYASIFVSAIIGSIISGKWNRKRFLFFWIFLGIISTASVLFFQGLIFSLFSGIFVGASFGLGFPSVLACFAESTTIEERGRVSGVLIFITFIAIILIGFSISPFLELSGSIVPLAIIIVFRATSFVALLIDPCERVVCKKERWIAVFTTHGYSLYFVSWLLFSVAAGTFGFLGLPSSLASVIESGLGSYFLYLGAILSALIVGFASDRYGRKNIILFGFISLGISYIFFGIAFDELSYLLTRIIYGAAAGTIFVVYGLTVIGDLAYTCSREKLMAIGVIPTFVVYGIFQVFSNTFEFPISPNVISAVLGVLSLISLIPLIYAPETLPKEKLLRKQLEEHLAHAREIQKKLKEKKNQQ